MQEDLIYDIGMHNGDDTAFYLHRGYRVVAVEANPALVAKAQQRFAQDIARKKLTILSRGIAEGRSRAPFYVCDDHSEWSSFDRAWASQTGRYHAVEVDCCPLSDILHEFGTPYYLKIDIEGADVLCLRDIPAADPPSYVSAELADVRTLLLLSERGYQSFKCVYQNDHTPLDYHPEVGPLPSPSPWRWVEATATDPGGWRRPPGPDGWSFPFGSTGPFGEEAAGVWRSLQHAAFSYLALNLGYASPPGPRQNRWLDVHASRQPPREAGSPAPSVADTLATVLDALNRKLGRLPKIWLFGAGRHTQRLLEQSARWSVSGTVLGLIDDHPGFSGPQAILMGLPVRSRQAFTAELAHNPAPDAIILSSDTFEDNFWNLTAEFRARGIPVLRLYGAAPGQTAISSHLDAQ